MSEVTCSYNGGQGSPFVVEVLAIMYMSKFLRCTIFVDCHFQTFRGSVRHTYFIVKNCNLNFCKLLAIHVKIMCLKNLDV